MVSEIIEIHVFFMSYRDTILNGKININFTAGNYFRFAILCSLTVTGISYTL
jgi:hypothetical protein